MKFRLPSPEPRVFRFFLLFLIQLAPLAFASQDQVTVPVIIAIEPFYILSIESEAVEVDREGKEISRRNLDEGSLFFGAFNPISRPSPFDGLIPGKSGKDTPEETFLFNTTHYSLARVSVASNQNAFTVTVEITSDDPARLSVLHLKIKDNPENSALHLRIQELEDTTHSENLVEPHDWRAFTFDPMMLYDSNGEAAVDRFLVDFAFLNMDPMSRLGTYGGYIVWTLHPEM